MDHETGHGDQGLAVEGAEDRGGWCGRNAQGELGLGPQDLVLIGGTERLGRLHQAFEPERAEGGGIGPGQRADHGFAFSSATMPTATAVPR